MNLYWIGIMGTQLVFHEFYSNIDWNLMLNYKNAEEVWEILKAKIEDMVKEKIRKLKPHSAKGPENITARLLKDNKEALISPLCIIYRKSMSSRKMPEDWRIANVTPIFKKGTKTKAENYRPVSLTSIPCKMFEAIIKDQLINQVLDNPLIKNTQHGFLSNKSCTRNLLEFLEKVTEIYDINKPLDIIYLDYAKPYKCSDWQEVI